MTGKSTSTSKITEDRLDSVALDVRTATSNNDVGIAPRVVCRRCQARTGSSTRRSSRHLHRPRGEQGRSFVIDIACHCRDRTRSKQGPGREEEVHLRRRALAIYLCEARIQGLVSGHVGSDLKGGLVARYVHRVPIRIRGEGEELIVCMNRNLVHAQGPIREVRSGSDDPG
jgi:hypothetical protein